MENNNGRGVFYGVIGVATLIVAIIGATFAYFSAQTNTDTNAIRAESAIIQLEIETDTTHTNLGDEMIPVEADGETAKSEDESLTEQERTAAATAATKYSTIFPRFPSAGTTATGDASRLACNDLLGNRICSIYTFTVSNPSTATQKIYGFLTVQDNTFTNLKYAVFKGTPTDVAGTLTGNVTNGVVASGKGWNVLGTVVAPDSNGNYTTIANGGLVKRMTSVPTSAVTTANTSDELSYIPGMTVTLTPDNNADGGTDEVTYTVLLWIEETGDDQTTGDSYENAGETKKFNGGILVNTSGGGDGVTATLELAAAA